MQVTETHQFTFNFTIQDMPFNFTIVAASKKGAIETLKVIMAQMIAELNAGDGVAIATEDLPKEPGA